jgi:hypothetical protein
MGNKAIAFYALLGACGIHVLLALPVHGQGVTQALCQSHSAYVVNASQMQRQQMPLDVALRMVRSVWQRQPRLAGFLEDSITEIYRNPVGMADAQESSRWQQVCERHLMGS